MSAGSHFNPTRRQHSYGGSGHAGDLPLLMADPRNGSAEVLYATTQFTLTPGPLSVIGKAVIVHRDPDSPAQQPDGNAGPRLACGVIRAVEPGRK
jgi:Cu-Zn family superoxide dismutase